jgi:O-antigen/teichoic acid export membrane protein
LARETKQFLILGAEDECHCDKTDLGGGSLTGSEIVARAAFGSTRLRTAFSLPEWASSATVAVIDQGVVSGMNFLALVIVGRSCGASELGIYSLSTSLLLLLAALVEALVTGPYAIHIPRMKSRSAEYAGSLVVHSWMLGSVVTVLLIASTMAIWIVDPRTPVIRAMWPVALVVFPIVFRETARRHAFAHNRADAALALDACITFVQLIGLLFCAARGILSSAVAISLIGGACTVGCVAYYLTFTHDVRFEKSAFMPDLKLNMDLGKWLFGSQVTMIAQFSAAQWAVTLTQGPGQNGLLIAAISVAMIANPVLTGLSNLFLPKAAQTVQVSGEGELARTLKNITLVMAIAMACYCVLITIFGHKIVFALYGGKYFPGTAALLLLSLAFAARSFAMPPYIGLWVILRPRVNIYANLCGTAAILVFVVALKRFGVAGAACSMVIGESIACVFRWYTFLRSAGQSLVARQTESKIG